MSNCDEIQLNASEPKRPEALKAEFERSPEEVGVWEKILNTLESSHRLTTTGTSVGDLSSIFRRIESGFVFAENKEDDDFSLLHIEPLLDPIHVT